MTASSPALAPPRPPDAHKTRPPTGLTAPPRFFSGGGRGVGGGEGGFTLPEPGGRRSGWPPPRRRRRGAPAPRAPTSAPRSARPWGSRSCSLGRGTRRPAAPPPPSRRRCRSRRPPPAAGRSATGPPPCRPPHGGCSRGRRPPPRPSWPRGHARARGRRSGPLPGGAPRSRCRPGPLSIYIKYIYVCAYYVRAEEAERGDGPLPSGGRPLVPGAPALPRPRRRWGRAPRRAPCRRVTTLPAARPPSARSHWRPQQRGAELGGRDEP